jgi:hypothetical protein
VVHICCQIFSLVPSGEIREIAEMLNAFHAAETSKAAAMKMTAVPANKSGSGVFIFQT